MRTSLAPVAIAILLALSACSNAEDATSDPDPAPAADDQQADGEETTDGATAEEAEADDPTAEDDGPPPAPVDYGDPPPIPDGPLSPELAATVDGLLGDRFRAGVFDDDSILAIQALGESGDPRVAWWLSDLLRITQNPALNFELGAAASNLLGVQIDPLNTWGSLTNHLIAWDVPAPPDYVRYKQNVYGIISAAWEPFFADTDAEIDWRHVSWGGVGIDDRPYDATDARCNCIPAADNPDVTDAAGGAWLPDDAVVFGLSINGESRAYPRSIMEVREMVNDTLGGRDIGMPYCTLCGSAQAYYTDEVPDGVARPVLRTSGLLIRSNKVMYDVETFSVFDTFLGNAVSGPLAEQGIVLPQAGVVTTTWGQWKADHPDTTILAEELALGRPDSDLRNTRDGDGPIFPIGDVDPRLPVQEDVLGVVTESGQPVAFQVTAAIEALEAGEEVGFEEISLELDGGGVRAVDGNGDDVGGHQAFWFAWSQFQPDTVVWPIDA
ncbi:MAG: DUF3179 domain-containing (seleno)protein [Actinomycetota bacterium]